MSEFAGIIIVIVVFCILWNLDEWIYINRRTPPGYQRDRDAVMRDLANGMSKQEVMRKSNRGGYDIRK